MINLKAAIRMYGCFFNKEQAQCRKKERRQKCYLQRDRSKNYHAHLHLPILSLYTDRDPQNERRVER